MSGILTITDANYETEVIKSKLPILVDFWAVWCIPCKTIHPIVEELANEYNSKVKFAKCDVDANNKIATQHGIRSIPTLLIFKGGKVVEQIIGAVPKQHIKAKLDKVLA
jgi:thioredoxin 1